MTIEHERAHLAAPRAADAPASEPAYLKRIATLPASLAESAEAEDSLKPALTHCPECARLGQIEQALSVLASVVTRLAKEAQQSRPPLRSTDGDPTLDEERRVQGELVRSLQARLSLLEERLARQNPPPAAPQLPAPSPDVLPESAPEVAAALTSIRHSLAALTLRRSSLVTKSGDHG